MKELILVPIFFALMMGFSLQLFDIAQASSQKALAFTEDMSNAMDCATRAKNLSLCSPNLFEHDFSDEINKTLKVTGDIQSSASSLLGIDSIEELSDQEISINGKNYRLVEVDQ